MASHGVDSHMRLCCARDFDAGHLEVVLMNEAEARLRSFADFERKGLLSGKVEPNFFAIAQDLRAVLDELARVRERRIELEAGFDSAVEQRFTPRQRTAGGLKAMWNPMTADVESLEHVLQAHIENGDIPVEAVLRLEPKVIAELLLDVRDRIRQEREDSAEDYEDELKTDALLEEVLGTFPDDDGAPFRLMKIDLLERIRKHLKR